MAALLAVSFGMAQNVCAQSAKTAKAAKTEVKEGSKKACCCAGKAAKDAKAEAKGACCSAKKAGKDAKKACCCAKKAAKKVDGTTASTAQKK